MEDKYKLTTKDAESAKIWEKQVSINVVDGDYSEAVILVTSKLGKYLDEGLPPKEAESKAIKGSGITGFMAGIMANYISQLHPRGEEFKIYWNTQFGVSPKEDRVVNPAIVNVDDETLEKMKRGQP